MTRWSKSCQVPQIKLLPVYMGLDLPSCDRNGQPAQNARKIHQAFVTDRLARKSTANSKYSNPRSCSARKGIELPAATRKRWPRGRPCAAWLILYDPLGGLWRVTAVSQAAARGPFSPDSGAALILYDPPEQVCGGLRQSRKQQHAHAAAFSSSFPFLPHQQQHSNAAALASICKLK